MIREDNGPRGDCRIEIGNQKTRTDKTIPEPGIRPLGPPRAVVSNTNEAFTEAWALYNIDPSMTRMCYWEIFVA